MVYEVQHKSILYTQIFLSQLYPEGKLNEQMRPAIIGLLGKMGSGKSTYAHAIADACRVHHMNPHILSYAAPIKHIVHDVMKLPKDPKPRTLYQAIGEGAKEYDALIWNKYMEKQVSSICNNTHHESGNPPLFIIDDVRFPSEIDHINEMTGNEGRFVSIHVPCELQLARLCMRDNGHCVDYLKESLSHPTEHAVDETTLPQERTLSLVSTDNMKEANIRNVVEFMSPLFPSTFLL